MVSVQDIQENRLEPTEFGHKKEVTQLSGCHDYNLEVLLKALPYLWIKCPAHWLHGI